jgi:hypothetical protein
MGKGFSSPSNNVVGDVQPFPSSSGAAVPAFDSVFDDDEISGDLTADAGSKPAHGRGRLGDQHAVALAERKARLQRSDTLLARMKRQRQQQKLLEESRKQSGSVASRQVSYVVQTKYHVMSYILSCCVIHIMSCRTYHVMSYILCYVIHVMLVDGRVHCCRRVLTALSPWCMRQ